jgi:hypothetical protein
MAQRKPWRPRVDNQTELNPFVNSTSGERLDNDEINDPEEDSAPLQGTHDLSDDDSLDDVISDASEPPR